MNLLNIDVKDNIPDMVDALVKVYGNEYRDIIAERIDKIHYVMYNDVDCIENYVDFLKTCKQKELSIKFLEQIGIDVSKYQGKSWAKDLDEDTMELLEGYIGVYFLRDKSRREV